jgi:hypothetical protein
MKYKNKKIPIDAAFADVPGLQEEGNHLTNAAENGNHRAAISLLEDPAKRLIRARRFSRITMRLHRRPFLLTRALIGAAVPQHRFSHCARAHDVGRPHACRVIFTLANLHHI